MSNAIDRAEAFLQNQLVAFAGVTVTYRRGQQSIELAAVPGATQSEDDQWARSPGQSKYSFNDTRAIRTARLRDFHIEADLIRFNDQQTNPQPGDQIHETIKGRVHVFEVLPLDDEPCFRPSGGTGHTLRIHTKLLAVQ